MLPKLIKESKHVIFNGDNYSEAWHKEAEKRGLPNFKNTVDCLPMITEKPSVDLFTKYKVYSKRELESRAVIFAEAYTKTVTIEANTMLMMAKTMILPSAIRYQGEVAQAVASAKMAGVDSPVCETLHVICEAIGEFQKKIANMEKAASHHADGDELAHATYARDHLIPAMVELRKAGDKLESMIADELWPIPTYREMLFLSR